MVPHASKEPGSPGQSVMWPTSSFQEIGSNKGCILYTSVCQPNVWAGNGRHGIYPHNMIPQAIHHANPKWVDSMVECRKRLQSTNLPTSYWHGDAFVDPAETRQISGPSQANHGVSEVKNHQCAPGGPPRNEQHPLFVGVSAHFGTRLVMTCHDPSHIGASIWLLNRQVLATK